jgi:hypothetical protein
MILAADSDHSARRSDAMNNRPGERVDDVKSDMEMLWSKSPVVPPFFRFGTTASNLPTFRVDGENGWR